MSSAGHGSFQKAVSCFLGFLIPVKYARVPPYWGLDQCCSNSMKHYHWHAHWHPAAQLEVHNSAYDKIALILITLFTRSLGGENCGCEGRKMAPW